MKAEISIEMVMLKSKSPPLITTRPWPIAKIPIMHILKVTEISVVCDKKSLRWIAEAAISNIHVPVKTKIVVRYSEVAFVGHLGIRNRFRVEVPNFFNSVLNSNSFHDIYSY
jgi:hypothetical protein